MTGHLRATFLYHLIASLPLLTFAVAFMVAKLTGINGIALPWKVLALCLVAFLALSAVAYLFVPITLDDAEAGLAGASALAMRGLPVYPDSSAPERYALLYGPLASLSHIPFYYLFGENLFSFKLAGVLGFLGSLVGLYGICRKYADAKSSLLGLGCASVLLFQYFGYDFWGRSDPLILFLLIAAIWVSVDGPTWGVVAVASVALGVLPNLKLSAGAYLLPVLGFIFIQRGWRIALWTVVGGMSLFAIPFALPQVSLPNYLFILNVAKHHGFNPDFLARNVEYSVMLVFPLALLARYAGRDSLPASPAQLRYFGLIVCAMAVTCVLGSKVGAGNYHLFPYVAPLLHLYFWRRSDLPPDKRDLPVARFAIPLVATLLFYSSVHVRDYIRVFKFYSQGSVAIAEIRAVEGSYKGRKIEVGVGEKPDDPLLSYGSVSAFDGEPYTLNFTAIRDMQLGGVEVPDSTVRYMRDCGTDVWLIPKSQAPFAASNSHYESYHPAFGEPFRNAFLIHYQKVKSLAEYDVWLCGPPPAGHN